MKENKQMKYEINLNDNTYQVIITKKKIKRLIIKVNHKKEILVSCPNQVSYNDALNYVFKNTNWVENIFKKYDVLDDEFEITEYYNDEIIYIQGVKYLLVEDSSISSKIVKEDNVFYYKGNISSTIDSILRSYYYLIEAEFDRVYKAYKTYIKQKPVLSIRKMKSRWGSCNYTNGKIVINKMLVSVPTELLNYVIVHEFTHLLYPNHSKDFYNFISQVLPNYKNIEKNLKKYQFLLNK